VRWIRELLAGLAAEGRTVLVSSHLMAEMALTAQRVVVVGRGRLLADAPLAEIVGRPGAAPVTLEQAYLELTADAVEFGASR
jgi:ABC-2 type transport system ATP-binding protein